MPTAERIRALGFRRWYERALIEGHAYLVTCFLGMVLTLAGAEIVGGRGSFDQFIYGVALGAAGIALAIFGWQRYYRIMNLAEHLSSAATCPQCGTYGIFSLIAAGESEQEASDNSGIWLKVKCRHCGNGWTI